MARRRAAADRHAEDDWRGVAGGRLRVDQAVGAARSPHGALAECGEGVDFANAHPGYLLNTVFGEIILTAS